MPRTNYTSNQKPKPSRETAPLSEKSIFRPTFPTFFVQKAENLKQNPDSFQ